MSVIPHAAGAATRLSQIVYGNGGTGFALQWTRSISQHRWKGKAPYKAGWQKMVNNVFVAANVLGFDNAGATTATIAGAYHNHGEGKPWMSVQFTRADGVVLHHKKKDGSEWDRIHLYYDTQLNHKEEEYPVEIYTKPKLD